MPAVAAMSDDFFAPPAFKADEALQALRRALRDLKLAEREGRFEWKGQALVELALDGAGLRARTAKQPAMTPDWNTKTLRSSADVRQYTEEFKRLFARWSERDE